MIWKPLFVLINRAASLPTRPAIMLRPSKSVLSIPCAKSGPVGVFLGSVTIDSLEEGNSPRNRHLMIPAPKRFPTSGSRDHLRPRPAMCRETSPFTACSPDQRSPVLGATKKTPAIIDASESHTHAECRSPNKTMPHSTPQRVTKFATWLVKTGPATAIRCR
jgi:hypothetical protein